MREARATCKRERQASGGSRLRLGVLQTPPPCRGWATQAGPAEPAHLWTRPAGHKPPTTQLPSDPALGQGFGSIIPRALGRKPTPFTRSPTPAVWPRPRPLPLLALLTHACRLSRENLSPTPPGSPRTRCSLPALPTPLPRSFLTTMVTLPAAPLMFSCYLPASLHPLPLSVTRREHRTVCDWLLVAEDSA